MVDKTTKMLDLLINKYQLRVQLNEGESAKLIGPVHRIFLTIGNKEKKFHLGDEEFENLMINIAWERLGMDFDPSDMQDLKKQLKAITTEPSPSPP
jgi:hypothetical protein